MRGKRIASVVGITILVLGMIAFGIPYPTVVEDPASDGEPSSTTYPVEMQVYDEHTAIQDADAIPPLIAAGAAIGGGVVAGYVVGKVSTQYPSANPASQLEAAFAANNLRTTSNTTSRIINGSTDEARLMAYSIAEETFAKSLAKNESLATAQTKAVEEVRDYLAQAQHNEIVVRNEEYLPTFMNIHENDGITVTDTATTCSLGPDSLNSLETTTSTLVNGTTVDHAYIDYDNCNSGIEGKFSLINGVATGLKAEVSDDDLDDRIIISSETMHRFRDSWKEFESIESEVVAEIDTFAQNVDPAEYADLDPSDIVSPTTAATQFGDAYDETQNPQYAAALAEQLGLDTQSNLTDSVTIGVNGSNRTGVIYGDYDELGGNLSVGDSYSDGRTAWLETGNGTVDLADRNWTVEGISDGDGGTKTTLGLSKGSQPSLSADDPIRRIQVIRERRENLGNESFWSGLTGGFGGGGLFGGSAPLGVPWIVWIIGVIGILLIATRE